MCVWGWRGGKREVMSDDGGAQRERERERRQIQPRWVEVEPTTRNWTERKNIPTRKQKSHHHTPTVNFHAQNTITSIYCFFLKKLIP